jgi:hypothetical protein
MKIVAEINQFCRDARTNDSLDQTRSGTMHASKYTTFDSICEAFFSQNWGHVFVGNPTRLKVIGLENRQATH